MVASLDDLDGDGIQELAVGSPGYSGGGESRGAVWLLYLDANPDVDVAVPTSAPPIKLKLFPNRPNPFNPATELGYTIPTGGYVSITIHDVSGRLVATVLNGRMPAGAHSIVWDGRNSSGVAVGSGLYFARLHAGAFTATRKMVLVR